MSGRESIKDLVAFLAVAREQSFTKAAVKLGVSQSALSHAMRQLEARLGVRLLSRTTRAVAPTEAGERLLKSIGPQFDEIEAQLQALSELRYKPAGTIRILASDAFIRTVLWPKLRKLLREYPDINIELTTESGQADIVTERYDAGVRVGEHIAKDMISVRIGPDYPSAIVGSRSYFEKRPKPKHPKDLIAHACINFRMPTSRELFLWRFKQGGKEFGVRVNGQVIFGSVSHALEAARDGFGLCNIPEQAALTYLKEGSLVRVLEEFSVTWDGPYLYYPSRRQSSPAFNLLVDALRYKE